MTVPIQPVKAWGAGGAGVKKSKWDRRELRVETRARALEVESLLRLNNRVSTGMWVFVAVWSVVTGSVGLVGLAGLVFAQSLFMVRESRLRDELAALEKAAVDEVCDWWQRKLTADMSANHVDVDGGYIDAQDDWARRAQGRNIGIHGTIIDDRREAMKMTVTFSSTEIVLLVEQELKRRGYRVVTKPTVNVSTESQGDQRDSWTVGVFNGVTAEVEDEKNASR